MYSIWYELRWARRLPNADGHPDHRHLLLPPLDNERVATFRTVAILPETNGRVSEIFVKWRDKIEKGAPIFKLDSTKQEADLELAKRRIVEVDAAMVMAQADIAAAEGKIIEAKGALQQAQDELQTPTGAQAA